MRTLKEIEELIEKHPPYSNKNDPLQEEEGIEGEREFVKEHNFSFAETWSLDHTVACFIAPRLCYLRDNHHGVPGEIFHEARKIAWRTDGVDADELADAIWTEKLDLMVEAFCLVIEEGESILNLPYDQYEKERRRRQVTIDEGMTEFAKYYLMLWD